MDVNRALGVNSSIGKQGARPGSLSRRRSTVRSNLPFDPKIEWMDTPEAHVLVAELPGFKEDRVKVQIDGGENVTISGARLIQDQVLKDGTWQPRRRLVSRFNKSFPLPKNVDIEGYTRRFENEKMYITFNKLKAPSEVKSTDIIDQDSKSAPQVGESSANFIEELSAKTDDKASSYKQDQSLRDENVIIPTVTKSSATEDEKDKSTKDEKFEAPKFGESIAAQDEKASRNKQDQSSRDENLELLGGAKSATNQDDKASSNTIDQSPRDEKVQTPGDAKSSMAQDEKELSNKFHQIPSKEMVKTTGGAKSTITQDEKELSNKPYQISGEEMVKALGSAKSTMDQDEKELSNKPNQIPREELVEAPKVVDDNTSSNKQDQSPRDEKLETPGDAKSATTLDNKVSIDKPHHTPRDEKVETPRGPKSTAAQNDKELSNKPDQSPRDEMLETKGIANSDVDQSSREEKVQTPGATIDEGNVGTPKLVCSSTTEETIQEKKQLEASSEVRESAKDPPLLNEEKPIDSTTLSNQSELLDSKKEVEMKVGGQDDQILVENPEVKSNPAQEEKVSSPKAKKEGDNFDFSQTKEDKHKAKQSPFRAFNCVSRFLPPRCQVIVGGIAVFTLGLFITSKFT